MTNPPDTNSDPITHLKEGFDGRRLYLGDHADVYKRSLTSNENLTDTSKEELVKKDDSSDNNKADKEYLQRYF